MIRSSINQSRSVRERLFTAVRKDRQDIRDYALHRYFSWFIDNSREGDKRLKQYLLASRRVDKLDEKYET